MGSQLGVVYQHWYCCNDDHQSQWENGNFDPCGSETPENIETKIGVNDYVMDPLQPCQFLWKSVQRGLLPILLKYSLLVPLCTFPFMQCMLIEVDGTRQELMKTKTWWDCVSRRYKEF